MLSLRKYEKGFKDRTICVFKENFETGLFTMKLHHLGHLSESLNKFRTLRFLYPSVYEQLNVFVKRGIGELYDERE